jgi:hypothetical protein
MLESRLAVSSATLIPFSHHENRIRTLQKFAKVRLDAIHC